MAVRNKIMPRKDPDVVEEPHTVNNSSDDLMDLSALRNSGRSISSSERRQEVLLHRLKCASERCVSLGEGSPQGPS